MTTYGQRLVHRWFVQYNPLYLVSAMLVLGGMIVTSRGLAQQGSVYGDVAVAAIAELYAAALIGGAALLVRIRQPRPAVMLALVTALYQCDLTLHTETCAYLGTVGLCAAAGWLALFVAKLYALAWAMKVRLSRGVVLTAAAGALGVTVIPHVLQQIGPRAGGELVAIWLFALVSLFPSRRVTSLALLDGWGETVLRRTVRAIWILWGILLSLHVLFWSSQRPLALGILVPVAPLVALRIARTEARVWANGVCVLVLVAVVMPASFWVVAGIAAVAIALRATSGQGNAPTAFEGAARMRLLTGAASCLWLAVWTVGWRGGPWPEHVLALDLAFGLAVVVVFLVSRVRIVAAPIAVAGLHALVASRIVPAPTSLVGWGSIAVGLGFAALAVSLAVSYRLRETSPRSGGAVRDPRLDLL